MNLWNVICRIHNSVRAYFVKRYRTQEVLRVFKTAHSIELRDTPINNWPIVTARHREEISAVRAGKLDIVDRKSWTFPFLPASVTRLAIPILKSTPYNLRRCSRTPVPRRAINLIKGSVISQPWAIEPIKDTKVDDEDEQKERIKIAEKVFHHPNNQDSFQSFLETGIEDMCILGAWAFELRYTMDIKRPLKLWSVMIESVRIFPSWSESLTDMPHYAQMTGLKGERGALIFYDDEMAYVKDNPATDSPFGLGKMEVGFQSIISFLGIQDMSGRAGTDQVHKTWLWFEQPQADSSYQILRRHIQNELEGQAKVSIIGGMKKPDVVEIQPVLEEDLLLNWQEMLIRMIANSFDMSAMALGIEHDINRAVGSVLDDKDFRSAVVPMARRLQEAFTRKILHEKLGWYDLQFRFLQLDDPDIETKSDLCARMYSANALTPNQFRKKMGDEPLESPMADLTQAEQMMLNMETMARVQEASTQRMTQFQDEHAASMPGIAPQVPPGMPPPQAPQPGQAAPAPRPGQSPGAQPPPGGQQQTAPGSPLRITPGNVARGGQIQSPKPMTTPKFPILGSKYNAKDIARMPVNQLTDVWMSGQLGNSPSKLIGEMMNQDPGILEQMTEEVKQFLDQVIQEEQDQPKKKLPLKVLHKWEKDQVTRFKRDAKRIADFATWLTKRGVFMGRPGGAPANKGNITQGGQVFKPGTTNSGRPGRPGNNNPLQRW
jgi:Phage portal protein